MMEFHDSNCKTEWVQQSGSTDVSTQCSESKVHVGVEGFRRGGNLRGGYEK